MDRSPYGTLSLELVKGIFLPLGFVVVGQEVRGTAKSGGAFDLWASDVNDTADLGAWISNQTWSNGDVYTFGASADGFSGFSAAYTKPSWLRSQYFVWTTAEPYLDLFPGGTYRYALIETWLNSTLPSPVAQTLIQEVKKNEAYSTFWLERSLFGLYSEVIVQPAAFFAGFYDIFLEGNINTFIGYNYEAVEGYRNQAKLLVDPLGHCQAARELFNNTNEANTFRYALAIGYESFGIPLPLGLVNGQLLNVTWFVMSSRDDIGQSQGNYYTTAETFPAYTPLSLYLHRSYNSNTLELDPPAPVIGSSASSESSKYIYDPSNPVPTIGGNNLFIPCGPLNQVPLDGRTDILTFDTSPFSSPFAITGPMEVKLYVSSNATDTDFMVKLVDVYPDRTQAIILQDSALRMRWRDQTLFDNQPQLMQAGQVYEIVISLLYTSYIVQPEHALRLTITSSNFPRFSVNQNNGEGLLGKEAAVIAENVIYHSSTYPSQLILPLVELNDLHRFNG